MAKENRTFHNVNDFKTNVNLSQNWQFRNLMATENIKILAVLLETSREYTPAPYLSLKRKHSPIINAGYAKTKRITDIVGALFGLIITLPISIILVLIIKITSNGRVFYSQERVGRQGRRFHIYKFRSMVENAEVNGPQLATTLDKRITVIGKLMRRFKLDEIPNFMNVLIGDMSLVGYRPERSYYIEQMRAHTSQYHLLLQIKPGLTSFGQIRFGYAATVEEMVQRLKYDLEYLNKISVQTDFSILFNTIQCIVKGNRNKG